MIADPALRAAELGHAQVHVGREREVQLGLAGAGHRAGRHGAEVQEAEVNRFFSLQARSPARNTAAAWVSATWAHGSSRDQPAVGRSGLLIGITPVFVTFPPGP